MKKIDCSTAQETFASKLKNKPQKYFFNGKWGSGKTTFIKDMAESHDIKLIEINLWKTDAKGSIFVHAFRKLHPTGFYTTIFVIFPLIITIASFSMKNSILVLIAISAVTLGKYLLPTPDDFYLGLLKMTPDEIRNTTSSGLTGEDPDGTATAKYYSGLLNNRFTYLYTHVDYEYVDPSVPNDVTSSIIDPDTGAVIDTETVTSDPQEIIVEGQSTVKVHYIDEAGNTLAPVQNNYGWPTSDLSHGGEQFDASALDIAGFTLNPSISSIPGVTLSGNDQFAHSKNLTVDYPNEGEVTDIYYVYTKDSVAGGDITAKYVDTDGNTISDDVVKSGNIGEDYSTEQLDIPGYTFKEVQGAASGKFTDTAQTVTYVYTKDSVTPEPKQDDRSNQDHSNEDSSYSQTLPETSESDGMGWMSVGMFLLAAALFASVFRFKKSKK